MHRRPFQDLSTPANKCSRGCNKVAMLEDSPECLSPPVALRLRGFLLPQEVFERGISSRTGKPEVAWDPAWWSFRVMVQASGTALTSPYAYCQSTAQLSSSKYQQAIKNSPSSSASLSSGKGCIAPPAKARL